MPRARGGDGLPQDAVEGVQPAGGRQEGRDERDDEREPEEMAEHAIVDALDGRNEMSGMVVAINAFDGCFLGNVMVSVQRRRKHRRHENSQQQKGNDASLQFHRAAKIDNSREFCLLFSGDCFVGFGRIVIFVGNF